MTFPSLRSTRLFTPPLDDLMAKLRKRPGWSDARAVGISAFVVAGYQGMPVPIQAVHFSGDLAAIGEFAPVWTFELTRSVLDGPVEVFESDAGGGIN